MTVLNEAAAIYVGTQAVDRVYAGSALVWEPPDAVVPWTPPATAEWSDGFETGDFSAWSAETDGSAQLAPSADAAHTGSWGARLLTSVRANANLRRSLTSQPTVEFGWYMRVSGDYTVDASPGQIFVAQLEQSTTRKVSVGLYAGSTIRIIDWQNFSSINGPTLDRDRWYAMALKAVGVGTASCTLTLAIDGVVVCTRSGSDWSSVSISNARLCRMIDQAWGSNPAGHIDFDNAYIDTSA